MNRLIRMAIFGLALLTLGVPWVVAPADEGPRPASDEEVQRLIEQLGDKDYFVRERASASLKITRRAIAAVRAATNSKDAEVRSRSEVILAHLCQKQLPAALAKMNQAKRDGKIDLFVEYATSLRTELTNESCPLYDLVQEITAETKRQPLADPDVILLNLGWVKHALYISPERCSDENAGQNKNVAVSNTILFNDILSDRVIVSRDGVVAGNTLGYSLILSNGNVVVRGDGTSIPYGIIVCDGDVEADTISRSVVIARGRVKHKKCNDSLIIDGERAALGKLSFFALSDVGLEVTEEHSRLRVKSVKKNSPFAKSGFEAGDFLLTANGKKVETVNDFRRLVRRHLAESAMEPKPLAVRAERDGKVRDLAVEFD